MSHITLHGFSQTNLNTRGSATALQVVIDSATEVNQVQLILLALEGCALCLVCTAWVWHLLQDVASLRYSMMAVFTAVPQGLIRRLATQKHRLTDDDEHDDEDDINPKLTQASKPAANSGEGGDNQQGKAVQSIKLHVKVSEDVEGGKGADAKPTGWRAVLRCLPGMRRIGADRHRKRRLQRSLHASLWLVWPFVVWGGLVIVADGVGYFLLSTITAPVAVSRGACLTYCLMPPVDSVPACAIAGYLTSAHQWLVAEGASWKHGCLASQLCSMLFTNHSRTKT